MGIVTKQQAKELGLTRYFTGLPCRKAHITERFVSTNRCIECSAKRNNNPKRKMWQKTWWANVDRKKRMILKQRGRAKERGIEFSITEKDLELPECCPILDLKLDYFSHSAAVDNIATIDRIDSSKGYIPGNIQIISFLANRIKSDASIDTLEKVLKYLKERRLP